MLTSTEPNTTPPFKGDAPITPLSYITLDDLLRHKPPLHFVGIGGAGMSALAIGLHYQGFTVTGSDITPSATTEALESMGMAVYIGHDATHVLQNALVVYSTAIDEHNPEIAVAKQRKQPLLHRSQVLQCLMHGEGVGAPVTIGLTGTHGKTTLTGMMDSIMQAAGVEATAIAGGKLPGLNQNIRTSESHAICIAELDESDGSILRYAPTYTVLANLELDHADHYTNGLQHLIQTFTQFFNHIEDISNPEGHTPTVVMNGQCLNSHTASMALPAGVTQAWVFDDEDALKAFTLPGERYLIRKTGDDPTHPERVELFHILEGHSLKRMGKFALQVPGWHNVWNAAQVAIVALKLGIGWLPISQGLHNFTGMGRRFEVLGELNGALRVDDYAHHPTEVMATLQATRERMAQLKRTGRLIACFQPHRYTRLQALWEPFLHAFQEADTVYIMETYHAHEVPIPGVDSEHFVAAMKQAYPHQPIFFEGDMVTLRNTLNEMAQPGDVILSMGAGTITKLLRA
jgi:UDP-N-acetylmuramate--alanine ligase